MSYGALIAAGATATAAAISAAIQNRRNKKAATRQYNRGQRDRAWQATYDQALWNQQNQKNQDLWNQQNRYNENRVDIENAYNRETWDLENKYNSPQQQMVRYQQAGLNPHLIYGQGTPGNAGDLAAGSMRAEQAHSNGMSSPDAKGYTREQVNSLELGQNIFQEQMQMKNLQVQTDNVEAHADNIRQDTINKGLEGEKKAAELPYSGAKAFESLEAARLNTEQLRIINEKHSADTHVAKATKQSRIDEIKARVDNLHATLSGIKLENALKAEKLNLRAIGIQDGDNMIFRWSAKFYKKHQLKFNKFDWKGNFSSQNRNNY